MKKYYLHIFVGVGYFLFSAGSCKYELLNPDDPELTEAQCIELGYQDECGVCDTDTTNDCVQDCANTWGGDDDSCSDCAGVVFGDSVEDECGICDNDSSNDCVQDCAGVWGGGLVDDICGVCGGIVIDPAECITTCGDGETLGCDGLCAIDGSEIVDDSCGVCDGDNSSCSDCAGVPFGDSLEDECGTCDNDSSNDCLQDCNNEWGGTLAFDECSVCGGDNSTCTDCNGVVNGVSFIDSCGNCIESIPGSWKIQIVAELVLMDSDDTLVDESTNHLGADILYTDGFDGFGIDIMEPISGPNPSLSFAFYHGDWEDAIFDHQQYTYFTQDIRNHNYNNFLNEGKIWNAKLKSINNWYYGTAKLTFNYIEGLSNANIIVNVIGSSLAGTSYLINDGDSIDGIGMSYNSIVDFDISISNLCY